MSAHWTNMTIAERCGAIVEVYPSTKGTGKTIAEALSARFKSQITRSSVISMYARHADKLKAVPLTGRPTARISKPVPGEPAVKKIRRPSALMVASGMQFVSPKPKPAPAPKRVDQSVPVRRAAQPALPEVASLSVPVPKNILLYQLNHCDCRRPVSGDREKTLFCAHPTRLEAPYCDFHATLSVGEGSRAERSAVPARLMR